MATTAVAAPAFTPAPGAHWLHPQTSSRVPRRWVFVDTEAWRDPVPGGEEQRWRLGVSVTTHWREGTHTWAPLTYRRHAAPADLWEAVAGHARKDSRTVVVAHNLGYDVRISDGLTWLTEHGWSVSKPAFGAQTLSLEARKDDLGLVLVDNSSWLPGPLESIANLMEESKLPLPDNAAGDDVWYDRCQRDVEILARAHMTVIDWLARSDVGGWGRSGASTGWHTLLRRHMTEPVLVHGRPEVREVEAQAMYAGRCEVWRWGRVAGGPFYEWDYELAYGHVAAETSLPTVLEGQVWGVPLSAMGSDMAAHRWLVQATVSTDVPVLPWRDDAGVLWPVGTFDGWWWETELVQAQDAGARVKVHSAWRYRAAPWLASWADWAIGLYRDQSSVQARIIGHMAKHWTRSVLGRTAMRYRDWQLAGPAYRPGVSYAEQLDLDSGHRGALLTLGDRRWEAWTQVWSDNAVPQVLSAVTAECRVRLWAAMTAAGLDDVVYCDTDSLVVTRAGHHRLLAAKDAGGLGSLRLKDHHLTFEAIAPQMATGLSYRRMAGIPRNNWVDEQGQRWGEYWEGVTSSLNAGHPDKVQVITRPIDIQGVDRRRLHLDGGRTEPFAVVGGVRTPALDVRTAQLVS